MDKSILIQYCDMQEEAKDLRERRYKQEEELLKMNEDGYVVTDFVKGTKKDGTYGSIKITGFPFPEYDQKRLKLGGLIQRLDLKEQELLDTLCKVEQYIESIEDARIRRIFRYRYIDNLNWVQIAHRMGGKHTAEGCRKAHERFLENN